MAWTPCSLQQLAAARLPASTSSWKSQPSMPDGATRRVGALERHADEADLGVPTFLTQVRGSTVLPVDSLTTFAASYLNLAPG